MDTSIRLAGISLALITLVINQITVDGSGHTVTSYNQVFPYVSVLPDGITYTCPSGWESRGIYCYKYFGAPLNYADAEKACQHLGGHMPMIRDMGDNLYVGGLIPDDTESIWTGSQDPADPYSPYSNWAVGEPDPDLPCTHIENDHEEMYPWSQTQCGMAKPFVCQMEACLSDEYKCRNGKCIKSEYVRDGENDCGDNSDEWNPSSTCEMKHVTLTSTTSQLAVDSPSTYPDNAMCIYILEGPVGYKIRLQFTQLSTERFHDVVSVYQGSPSLDDAQYAAHFSGVYSSGQLPPRIVSSNNWLILVLDTDPNNAGINTRRFRANIRVETEPTANTIYRTVMSEPSVIDYPSVANRYPINTNAHWELTAPSELDVITVKIEFMKLNTHDVVTFLDGDLTNSFQISFTGPINMEDTSDYFTSTTNKIRISMKTSSLRSDIGFKITYYLGCDVHFGYDYASITTPGQYAPTMFEDQIVITAADYPKLRQCKYTVDMVSADPTPVTLLSTENIVLGTGDTLTFTSDDNADEPLAAGSLEREIADGSTLVLSFHSNIDDTTAAGFIGAYSVSCPEPAVAYDPSQITGTYSSNFGSVFSVTCPNGEFFEEEEFENAGASVEVKCLFGGMWNTPRLPTCTGVYCGSIPSVDNARIADLPGTNNSSFTGSQAGDTVTYECLSGSNPSGSPTITCQDSGQWSTEPTCSRGICSPPASNPANGNLVESAGTPPNVGTVYKVKCNDGYEQTSGEAVIVCDVNENNQPNWNDLPSNVVCTALSCSVPSVANAVPPSPSIPFGNAVNIQCNSGFKIAGTDSDNQVSLTCVYDANTQGVRLDATVPSCVDIDECDTNADNCVTGGLCGATCRNTIGSFVCDCPGGTELNGAGTTCINIDECVGDHGCQDMCNDVDVCTDSSGDFYTCSCPAQGFTLYTQVGQNGYGATVQYGEDTNQNPGEQRVLDRSCIRAACPHPQGNPITPFANGKLLEPATMQHFLTGDVITYMCDLGYVIEGTTDLMASMTCQDGSTWNPVLLPVCSPVQCPSVTIQGLLNGLTLPPVSFDPSENDMIDFYDGTSPTTGVVTAICNDSTILSAVDKKLYCVFDFNDNTYKLMGDSLECADERVDCGTPNVPGLNVNVGANTLRGDSFTFACTSGTPSGKSSEGEQTTGDTGDDLTVTCLDSGVWDYGSLKCPAGQCVDPRVPHDGYYVARSFEEGEIIKFFCNREGFEPNPPALICAEVLANTYGYQVYDTVLEQSNGPPTFEDRPDCVDMLVPQFEYCPPDWTYWVDRFGYITDDRILKPVVTDNQGVDTLVLTTNVGDFELTQPVTADVTLTWRADDFETASTNTNTCTINIKLKSDSVPTINCRNELVLTLDDEITEIVISATSGNIDPVGIQTGGSTIPLEYGLDPAVSSFAVTDINNVRIIKQFARFDYGEQGFSMKAECPIAVILKPNECTPWAFERLKPAQSSLVFTDNNETATITCNDGYTFHRLVDDDTQLTELVYTCTGGASLYTTATGSFGSYVPQCVQATRASYDVLFEVHYSANDPITASSQTTADNYINSILTNAASFLFSDSSRCSQSTVGITITVEGPTVVSGGTTLEVMYKISFTETSSSSVGDLNDCRLEVETFYIENFGNNFDTLRIVNPNSQISLTGTYVAASLSGSFACPNGENVQEVASNTVIVSACVPCPPGYKTTDGTFCERCPVNTYQSQAGQDACTPCPDGRGTFDDGAHSVDQCYAQCPAPTTSATGMFPCQPCSSNTYWADPLTCTACPAGEVTRGPTGGSSEAECLDVCPAGTFSWMDGKGTAEECRACPIGHYSDTAGSTTCTQCPTDETTPSEGTLDPSQCEAQAVACAARLDCGDNGECQVTNGRQLVCVCNNRYTGDQCEAQIDRCSHNPCFYTGQCVVDPNAAAGYRCVNCPQEFNMVANDTDISVDGALLRFSTGTVDECKATCIAQNDCVFIAYDTNVQSNQCLEYGFTLTDEIKTANPGFNLFVKVPVLPGDNCEGEPDDCASDAYTADPCQNGGMCRDGLQTYSCLCPVASNFGGTRCQSTSDVCTDNDCTNGATCVGVPTGSAAVGSIYYTCNCLPGWTGQFCEEDINECDINPCWYGAACVHDEERANTYSCDCPTNELSQSPFTGTNCETRSNINLCSAASCSYCVEDYSENEPMCLCEPGETEDTYITRWFNADEPTLSNPSTEQSQGDYETLEQHRARYGNEVCNGVDNIDSVECRRVGEVSSLTDAEIAGLDFVAGYECTEIGLWCNDSDVSMGNCDDYEVRYTCRTRLGFCQNIDECLEPVTVAIGIATDIMELSCDEINTESCSDNGYGLNCNCVAGVEGYFCDEPIDDCVDSAGNPVCQNDATCIDQDQEYECTCVTGFEGDNCEINIDNCATNPCDNGATCVDGIDSYTCNCAPGYTGPTCMDNIDQCSSNPCRNGAECVDAAPGVSPGFTCVCREPWIGTLCTSLAVLCTDNTCNNNGQCFDIVNDTYCSCSPGSVGDTCLPGQDICQYANPCTNGGVCSIDDGEPVCDCPEGRAGDWCESTRDYCSDTVGICQNGGTCTLRDDLAAGYSCECAPGFTGNTCQTNINDCASVSCGSGTCLDGVQVAYCDCPFSRIGNTCGKTVYRDYDLCVDENTLTELLRPFTLGSEDLSISFWVKMNGAGTIMQLITAVDELNVGEDTRTIVQISDQKVELNVRGAEPAVGNFDAYVFDQAINDGQWHHIVVTYSKAGSNMLVFVDDIRAEVDSILTDDTGDANFTDHAMLLIGENLFTGCVSLVQVWGKVLSLQEVTSIFSARQNDITNTLSEDLLLDWGWGTYRATSANFRRIGNTMRGLPVCEVGQTVDENSFPIQCQDTEDKKAPEVNTCPSDITAQLNPLDSVNPFTTPIAIDSSNFFVSEEGLVIEDMSHMDGVRLPVGKHPVVYNAYDAAGNRASCSYSVYVQFGDCQDTIPDSATTTPSSNGIYTDIVTSCTIPQLNLEPLEIVCGPSGILNTHNAYVSRRYPGCTTTNTDVKASLEIIYDYDITSGSGLSVNQEENMRTVIYQGLGGIAGFCPQDPCTADNVNIEFEQSTDRTTLSVTAIAKGTALTLSGGAVEEHLYEAIVQGSDFDNTAISTGVLVKPDTYRLHVSYMCDGENEEAWIPAGASDPVCAPCVPGTFYNMTLSECIYCPVGEYQSQSAQATCESCPDGQTTETYGSTGIADCFTTCEPGHYFDGSCLECPAGQFQPESGRNYCILCDFGYTTQEPGSVNEEECTLLCAAGLELNDVDECVECALGTYRVAGALGGCVDCPDATFTTPTTGSTSDEACTVKLCPAGQYAVYSDGPDVDPTCETCPVDTYSDALNNATSCTECGENERTDSTGSTNVTDCKFFCPAGFFIEVDQIDADMKMCVGCAKNSFKIETDYYATVCTDCTSGGSQPGTIAANSTSSADCIYDVCVPGEEIIEGAFACTPCLEDSYQPVNDPKPRSELCISCGDGFGTANPGSDSQEDCKQFCPSGQELNNTLQCQECAVGFYKDNSEDRFANCTECPTGFVTADTGSTLQSDCNIVDCGPGEEIEGNACQPCPVGTYNERFYQEECEPCPSGTSTSAEGSTSVNDCNQYPDTQPYLVTGLQFDQVFTGADETWATSLRQQLDTFFSDDTSPNHVAAYRTVNILGVTWHTDNGLERTDVVVQVLADNTGFTSDADASIETLRQAILQRIIDFNNDANSGVTSNSQPSVMAQPDPLCSNGEFRNATMLCEPCEVGEYQPQGTVEVCIPCLPGYSTVSTGGTDVDVCIFECGTGQEANAANDGCEMCDADSIKPSTLPEVAQCNACTDPATHANDARTECFVNSVAGQYSTATEALPCPENTYSEQPNVEECTTCPDRTGTVDEGSTSASACNLLCPAGEQSNDADTSCEMCDETSVKGENDPEDALCSPCAVDFHANENRTTCYADSDPGQYSTTEGAFDCPQGSYSTEENQRSCTNCSGTQSTAMAGSDSASDCQSICQIANPCQNGATCETDGDEHTCRCTNDFQGDICTIEIDDRDTDDTPLRRFFFRLRFILDFFEMLQRESGFRQGLTNSFTNFLTRTDGRIGIFRRVRVLGLTAGSTDASMEIEVNATTLTSVAEVENFINNLQDELHDYTEQQQTVSDDYRTSPEQEQDFDITSIAVLPGDVYCDGGNQVVLDTNTCEPCPIGTYQPTDDSQLCRPCEGDFTTRQTGSTQLQQCVSPCEIQGRDFCNDRGDCVTDASNIVSCDCDDNFSGDRCTTRGDPSDSDETNLIIGLSVGGAILLLLVLSIIGCIVFNMRNRKPAKSQEVFEYPAGPPSVMGYYPTAAYPPATAYTSTYGTSPAYGTPLPMIQAQPAQGVDNFLYYDDQSGGNAYSSNGFY